MSHTDRETRKRLVATLTRACVLWTEDIMKNYFGDPNSTESQQMMLEALAQALVVVSKRRESGAASLETFLLEMQDLLQKEPK